MKRGFAAGHSFFLTHRLLFEDQLQLSILSCRVPFSRSSCSHPFSQGLQEADNFWQQLLIKNNYFFGRRRSEFQSFTASEFISQLYLQPSTLWHRASAFVTEGMTVIHSLCALYLFWWENLQSSCLSYSLSSNVYLVKKLFPAISSFRSTITGSINVLAAIHSFNGTAHFSDVKICSRPILPTLFFSVFQNRVLNTPLYWTQEN